ncbi:unnamed protein product [Amaranthus hypochondriacus]
MEVQNCCKQEHQVVILMVPLPAQGHLNQLLHFSLHISTQYKLPLHFAGSSTHNRQAKTRLHGWTSQYLNNIHFHDFKLPPYNCPSPKPDPLVPFPSHLQPLFDSIDHLRKPIYELVQELSRKFHRVVVIHDTGMASVVQDVKSIPNAENYSFLTISAFTLSAMNQEQFLDLDLGIPKSLPSMDGCFTPEILNYFEKQHKFFGFESGRICNTSRLIEGKFVEYLEKLSENSGKKFFPIGPLNPIQIEKKDDENYIQKWLAKHETDSVLYVSFGSTTSMTDEQITELALGLERSGVKFLWVLRNADNGDIFSRSDEMGNSRDCDKVSWGFNYRLPDGYEERVKERGMVIREWVSQLEILAHPSIGGFISHCGWNSCMESISMGVPIATWPMHSDQPRNAVLITDVLKIGIQVKDWACRAELVSSSMICDVVVRLMVSDEGKEIRKRAQELGDRVRASVSKDGVFRKEIDLFISHITRL